MRGHAIFLSGPIGTGKTTLGRALAERLGGEFIDGDGYTDQTRPWYCSIKRTSEAIVANGLSALETVPAVVVAYPLGCMNWIYFRRKFGDAGATPLFVSLRASYESITNPARGRVFAPWEHNRIREMIGEGYGARPFSDFVFDTDAGPFDETATRLTQAVRARLAIRP
ncbi:MAG: shikimate kinase [Rhizomicrobium sp.]